jgi:sugar lactone lactonase YvrE
MEGKVSRKSRIFKAGRKILVYDGNAQIPDHASPRERDLMKMPLISIAVLGDTLYATDALKGRVLLYNKKSGELKREIPVTLAYGIAVESSGRIWVGREHSKVSVFSPEGEIVATPINDLKDVRALALSGDKLYVADREAGQVRIYRVQGSKVSPLKTLGEAGRPGDRAPERLTTIQGMAVDSRGSIVLTDRIGQGSRMQKFTQGYKPLWRQMGLEFSSQGAFGKDDPDTLFTSNRNAYRLDRKTGGWEFLGPAKTDEQEVYFGNFDSSHRGPPRIVRFGEKDFFYFPAGDGVAVYHIFPAKDASSGPTLKLAAALAGAEPLPDGKRAKEAWKRESRYPGPGTTRRAK